MRVSYCEWHGDNSEVTPYIQVRSWKRGPSGRMQPTTRQGITLRKSDDLPAIIRALQAAADKVMDAPDWPPVPGLAEPELPV